MATMKDVEITQESIEGQLSDNDVQVDHDSPFDEHQVVELQELTPDEMNKLARSTLPGNKFDLPKVAAKYRNAKSVRILITGKTGTGKSTLVNGILGVKTNGKGAAKEGNGIKESCTAEVTAYKTKKRKVDITVWDSPGLQDGTENQDSYLREMEKKCTPRDLTMYCIKVADTRFVRGTDNPDVVAMKKFTQSLGVDFWKNAIVVLTFANALEIFHVEWKDLQRKERATAFKSVIQEWRDQVQKILVDDINVPKEIVDKIPIIPAGHYTLRALPDRNYWLSALWFECLGAIPSHEGKAAFLKINWGRIKRKRQVKETDFKKEAEDQPIVLTESQKRGRAAGAAIGGALGLLGILGGPLVVITVPVGVFFGALIGLRGATQ